MMAGKNFYVNFELRGWDRAIKEINKYDTRTAMKIEDAISKSTKAIRKGAANRIHNVSGDLKKHTTSSFNKLKLEGTVRAKSPTAHLVEFGAKAVVMKAKDTVMINDTYGIRRYFVEAHIPARAAHPFMAPAYNDQRPILIKDLKDAVQP